MALPTIATSTPIASPGKGRKESRLAVPAGVVLRPSLQVISPEARMTTLSPLRSWMAGAGRAGAAFKFDALDALLEQKHALSRRDLDRELPVLELHHTAFDHPAVLQLDGVGLKRQRAHQQNQREKDEASHRSLPLTRSNTTGQGVRSQSVVVGQFGSCSGGL